LPQFGNGVGAVLASANAESERVVGSVLDVVAAKVVGVNFGVMDCAFESAQTDTVEGTPEFAGPLGASDAGVAWVVVFGVGRGDGGGHGVGSKANEGKNGDEDNLVHFGRRRDCFMFWWLGKIGENKAVNNS